MNFDEVIQLQVLKLKATQQGRNGPLLDHLIEQAGETPELRQMCAKVSSVMYAELEQVVGLLDMSKREFIEAAVGDALARARQVIDSSRVLEGL